MYFKTFYYNGPPMVRHCVDILRTFSMNNASIPKKKNVKNGNIYFTNMVFVVFINLVD